MESPVLLGTICDGWDGVMIGYLVGVPWHTSPVQHFFVKHSNIFRYLNGFAAYRLPKIFGLYPQEKIEYLLELFNPLNERTINAVEVTRALMLTLSKEVEGHDGNFIIHAFDNAFTVEKELSDKYAVQYGKEFTNLDLFYPVNAIEIFSVKNNIPFINLTNSFLEHKKTHPSEHIFIPNIAGHFTPLGTNLVGNTIAKEIIRRGFVSCS